MGKNNYAFRRQKNIRDVGSFYKKKFKWLNSCVYCGQNKESIDHVFPLSIAARLDLERKIVRDELKFGLYLVPSCMSCNLICMNKPFQSILEKRAYIQKTLREKHKKEITTVMWDKEEIDELGENLKRQVIKMLNNRFVIESRILYPVLLHEKYRGILFD